MASALALCVVCGAEMLLQPMSDQPASVALALSLAVLVGVGNGLWWALTFAVLKRLPTALRFVAWSALALGTGHWLAQRLGAYQRLHGHYNVLALQALAGSFGLALALAVAASLLQPTQQRPVGVVFGWSSRARLVLGACFVLASAGAFYADHRYYTGLYAAAHDALRWTSWLALMFAFALVLARLPRVLSSRLTIVGLSISALVCAVWVGSARPFAMQLLWLRPWTSVLVATANGITDRDHDGYSALLAGDCADDNPKINPGAREVPGNGIDDNCLLGDAKKPAAREALPPVPTTPSPYDVVFVTVDTWRPDHLGLYNPRYAEKGRSTTPNLDLWAKQATVFQHAYATGGWTSISIASMMRGLYPRRLTWTRRFETTLLRLVKAAELPRLVAPEQPQQMFPLAWEDPHPTLAGLLRRRGMRTAAVVHDGFSTMLSHGVGVERDFDSYWEVETWMRAQEDDTGVVELARRELVRTSRNKRLFLWVHFFGPHSPNHVHEGTQVYGPSLIDGYDHELRFFDQQLPRLFAAIAARGTPTIIVLTGDHGEVFADPARMHGFSITEQDIRVPLLLRVPGFAPRKVDQLVSTVDLFPTLLALTETPMPERLDGIDLTPFARDGAPARPRTLISETWRYDAQARPIIDLVAAFDGARKVVLNTVDNTFHAFDQRDPAEAAGLPRQDDDAPLLDFLRNYVEQTGGALAPTD